MMMIVIIIIKLIKGFEMSGVRMRGVGHAENGMTLSVVVDR